MPRLPRVARSTSIELTLYSLQNLGASNYAIANRFGVDEKSVRNILKNASITKKLRADAFAALPLEERENYAECLELVDVIAVLYACANEDISLEGIRRLFCLTPPAFKHILSNAGRYVDAWDQIVRSAVSDLASNQRVPALPQAHGNAATDGIAYRRLSANDRDVVLQLHEHENMPQREIARVMQIGRSTVNRVVANRPRVLQSIGNQPLSSLHLTDVACTTTVQAHYLGPMDVKCDWCGALHYAGEPSRVEVINGAATRTFQDCCCHGKLQCDPLPYPDELKLLITGQDARSNHFHQRIRNYNSACAFASINASTYNFPNNGAYCYKVHGAIINKFNEAARADPEERPAYGQLYVINAEDAVAYRMDVPANEGVDEDLLREIDALLRRVNEYAKAYHMMGEIEERYRLEAEDECRQRGLPLTDAVVPTVRLAFDLKRRYERSYNVPVVSEVAAVFVTHGGGEMPDAHIVVHPRGRRVRTLSTLSADLNPMCLPLLFPYGTRGWTPNTRYHRVTGKRERVSRREHTASLLAVREGQFNPIHFAGKLAQEYVVCQYVYLEADRMQWFRENQKTIRAEHYNAVSDRLQQLCQEGNLTLGQRVILPATHPGSPRSQSRHYQDAMAIVQRFGKPQLFITMTANIGWREVEEACTYYVSEDPSDPTVRSTAAPGFIEKKLLATNRMDVVVRVFDLKKDALLKKITQGKFFGTHVAHVYAIEFQKRGNPHMHLLVTLDEASAPKTPADVDRMTRAVIPDRRHEPELFDLVKKHHIHGPCDMGDCVCLDDQGRCTKKFPKAFRNEAALGEDGYAEPARPDAGPCIEYANGRVAHNGFVVPYNPELLLEFNCHTNVELCGGIRFVNYVYKYIHKQLDSAHLEVTAEGTLNADEIKRYIDCRYVSPQEAVWRLFEKAMHGRSHSVFVLHVHQRHERIRELESDEPGISVDEDGRYVPDKSHLDAFFRLNQVDRAARSLYYYEVPEHYKWDAKDGKWVARTRASKTIGRLCNVDVRCSERFHLRLLLLHVKGPRNYDDLKIVDGRYYRTYAEACVARGLARDDMEWHACMTDAANWRLARQLRHLFVLILAWNSPKDPLALWNDFKEAMSVDFVRYHGMSQERAEQAAYAEIVDELAEYGKSLSDFPTLPKLVRPPAIDDEVVDREEALQLACEFYRKLTNEQQAIVHRVMLKLGMEAAGIAAGNKRVRPREGDGIFMDGPGGSGKSFTYWCIFHACRAYGFNVVVMASTGAAAILLPTGSTAHQAAGLPVPLFNDCTANPRGARLRKFANADVFIWDEAPMSPRYATEAVDQRLRELHGKDEPFGGAIMIQGGDFRQCLPIEEYSLVSEQVNLSVKRSKLWPYFTVMKLTKNLRLNQGQEEYAKWILEVGEGKRLTGLDGQERLWDKIIFRGDLLSEVYGRLLDGDPTLIGPQLQKYLGGRCILSPLNKICDWYNDAIIERLAGQSREYTSVDAICADSDSDQRRHPVNLLNAVDIAGFPPHKLRLKRNTVLMVLRNISPSKGIVNGTRMILMDMRPNVLLCRILNGSHAGEVCEIPRITLKYEGTQYPFKFTRHQFPVRVAFAMSVNKSQGQTLDFVGADLRHESFSHGQLYVILSRVRSADNIRIVCNAGSDSTKNIVIKEIL